MEYDYLNASLAAAVEAAAAKHGLDLRALRAVVEVESARKTGFYDKTVNQWLPVIRIEGHKVYKWLKNDRQKMIEAAAIKAVSSKMNAIPQGSQAKRWAMFRKLYAIDPVVAIKSTSFGVGQVLGENALLLDYASHEDFYQSVTSGLAGQIEAMIRYINKVGLIDELNERDWQGFARGYNGPAYKRYGYHTQMADAYARLSRAPDTDTFARMGDNSYAVVLLQRRLVELDHHDGVIDGDYGPATRNSVAKWYEAEGLMDLPGHPAARQPASPNRVPRSLLDVLFYEPEPEPELELDPIPVPDLIPKPAPTPIDGTGWAAILARIRMMLRHIF